MAVPVLEKEDGLRYRYQTWMAVWWFSGNAGLNWATINVAINNHERLTEQFKQREKNLYSKCACKKILTKFYKKRILY